MRIFTFGCSLTQYFYPTWADILITHYEDKYGAKGQNWGKSGAGNQFITTRVWEANSVHKFDQNDIILIQWTSMFREDRYHEHHGWHCPGGFNKNYLDGNNFKLNSFVYDIELQWADFLHCAMRDCAMISSTVKGLKHLGCKVVTTGFRHFDEGYETYADFQEDAMIAYPNLGAILAQYRDDLKLDIEPILNALEFGKDDDFFDTRPKSVPALDKKFQGHLLPETHPLPMEHKEFVERFVLEKIEEDSLHQEAIDLVNLYHDKIKDKDPIILKDIGWANREKTGFSDDGWRP